MAVHSYPEFWKALKQGPLAACYYFVGSEDVLKQEALEALLDRALDHGLRDFNLDLRSAPELSPEDIETLCATLPMMAERRVVVIRDVEGWAKRARGKTTVLRYLDSPSPETVLVLVQGAAESTPDADLAARCWVVEFGPLRRDHTLRWLAKRAQTAGLTLEPDAADHLLNAVEGHLGLAAAELGKLEGLGGAKPITLQQVESLVGIRRGETQFDWRDAVLGDAPARAVDMLPHVLSQPGVSGVKLVALLGQGLVGLGLARRLLDQGQRGPALERAVADALFRVRPFGLDYRASARAWAAWAPGWPRRRLRAALHAATAADLALKSTTISDERGILTDLVLSLALESQAAA